MKNTKSILFTFFLLPTATQCMEPIEKIVVAKPKTMQEIRNDRDKIYQKILKEERSCQLNSQHYRTNFDYTILDPIIFQNQTVLTINSFYYKHFRFKKCSCLGIATMRIERPKFTYEDRYGAYNNDYFIRNPKQAPFKEKKETIQLFKKNKVKKTRKDKRFAFLAKYEEFGPSIIQKTLILESLFLSSIPQEIIKSIALLMWETEESLL